MPPKIEIWFRGRTPRRQKRHIVECKRAACDGYHEGRWLYRNGQLPWECQIKPPEPLVTESGTEVWRHYEENVLKGFLDAAEEDGRADKDGDILLDKE